MKKALPLAALAVLAVLQTIVYWNVHLFYRARDGAADPAAKVRILAAAVRLYPWNDQAWFELGKARFDQGAEALGDARVRDAAFGRSVGDFLKALALNPGSAAAHFQFAQSLEYMSYLSLAAPVPYFDEFKKAAALTGHNSQVYLEVGKVLLARWESLRPEEKDFTLDILRKMMAGKNPERLRELLEIWHLHGQDGTVVEKILPEDAGCLRAYAAFLGEKSMSLETRQKALAKAESLDFRRARAEFDQGQRSLDYGQIEEAADRGRTAIGLLESIAFYQTLGRETLIDAGEFAELRKKTYLLAAKCQIEKTRSLQDPDHYLETYLAIEDEPLAVGELEKYLVERGLIESEESSVSRPRDLRTLAFELSLDFKQNRYRDITAAGESLEKSAIVIPEAARTYYARILRLVGDSYMKTDYIYEAESFFLKSLAAGPEDLQGLISLEQCYDRLNDDPNVAAVRRRINALLTPAELDLGRRPLRKGKPVRIGLVCDGTPLSLTVAFESLRPGSRPLLAVLLNGRIVREGYGEGGRFSFPLTPAAGSNTLTLETVNEPLTLLNISR
ncbi:MAG: hypothetical protein ABFD80_00395 [Acidobacteriota bacterium]